MSATDLRGLDLLDAAIDHIEKHPDTWTQSQYRCKTGMCLAGWTAVLAGGQFANPAYPGDDRLLPEPGDRPDDLYEGFVFAHERAERLLGLSVDDANELFAGGNKLADIKRMRDDLRAGLPLDREQARP
jgi:hypothetical protein